ncbi:superoxide dismutase 1, soluble [Baffinella frigidus]|nr:superoxide dismutase 1, soluble [Cryptophyta sp. CCMP2293]
MKGICFLKGVNGVEGAVEFSEEEGKGTVMTGKITGLPPGGHAFRIHQLGDMSQGPQSCGRIYNPGAHKGVAASESMDHQAGDVGQLTAGPDGVAEVPPPSLPLPA